MNAIASILKASKIQVYKYNGKKIDFKNHNDDYDLSLKKGDTFIVDYKSVYELNNVAFKFTLNATEIKELISNSIRVVASASKIKPEVENTVSTSLKIFGGYSMQKLRTWNTRRGIAYSADIYKDEKRLGNVEHLPERIVAVFDFNTAQMDKDAKRLKFENATNFAEELSFVVETQIILAKAK